MKQKLWRLALLAGCVVLGSSLSAPLLASPATPAMLSNTCNGCHGTDGSSAGTSNPTIAGLTADYFETAMKQFRSGERPSTIMGRLAKGYSDEQLKAMADHFAAKKFVRAKQAFDAGKAAAGKELHAKRCNMCHAQGGAHSGAGGVLAGQWKEYLQIAFAEYRAGKRKAPELMAKRMEGLSDADFDALINYYASQQ